MLSVPVYNETGDKVGQQELDEVLLGAPINHQLLKQAVVMYQANLRQGTVAQKTRAEVEGSTRKLYRQKGTGRARMGNARTPVRRGGGVAFPRKPRDFRLDMPKKMRRMARNQAVLAKVQSESVCIIDGVRFDEPKTKRFAAMLKALEADRGCVFATRGKSDVLHKSGRNIPLTDIMDVADLNAYAVLRRKRLVFTKDAFEAFVGSVANGTKAGG